MKALSIAISTVAIGLLLSSAAESDSAEPPVCTVGADRFGEVEYAQRRDNFTKGGNDENLIGRPRAIALDQAGRDGRLEIAHRVGRIGVIYIDPRDDSRCLMTCSGLLIRDGSSASVLTAHHCFTPILERDTETLAGKPERAEIRFSSMQPNSQEPDGEYPFEGHAVLLDPVPTKIPSAEWDTVIAKFDSTERYRVAAMLRTHPLSDLKFASPVKGSQAYIIGYPGGGRPYLYDACVITEVPNDVAKIFSHTCATLPGVSGGPVFSVDGSLIGVHTFGPGVVNGIIYSPNPGGIVFADVVRRYPDLTQRLSAQQGADTQPAKSNVVARSVFKLLPDNLDQILSHFQLGQYLSEARAAYGDAALFRRGDGNALILELQAYLAGKPFRVVQRYDLTKLADVQIRYSEKFPTAEAGRATCEEAYRRVLDQIDSRLPAERPAAPVIGERTKNCPAGNLRFRFESAPSPLAHFRRQIKFNDSYRILPANLKDVRNDSLSAPITRETQFACNKSDSFYISLDETDLSTLGICSVEVTTYPPGMNVLAAQK